MAEESKLVEEVIASTEETKQEGFDPTSFLGGESQPSQDVSSQPVETEAVQESVEKELDMDDFSWDSIEAKKEEVEEEPVEEIVQAKEETEEDWDSEETEEVVESKTTEEFNWNELSKETGVEAESKEEFIAKVQEALKPQVSDNDTIKNLNGFLELTDKDLVIADMRASKYDDDAT